MLIVQALSVGIFPYVLKLLQSSARELRPLLVFIWAKLLAVDSVRNDLTVSIHQLQPSLQSQLLLLLTVIVFWEMGKTWFAPY